MDARHFSFWHACTSMFATTCHTNPITSVAILTPSSISATVTSSTIVPSQTADATAAFAPVAVAAATTPAATTVTASFTTCTPAPAIAPDTGTGTRTTPA